MKSLSLMSAVTALGAALLCAATFLQPADATQPALDAVAAQAPAYSPSASSLLLPLVATAPPAPLLGVVSSVMPPNPPQFEFCSVDSSFTTCSAQAAGERCSALNANDNVCTVTRGNDNSCSVHVAGEVCSVLPPIMTGGDSTCSSSGGEFPAQCSTLTTDGKQRCSAKAIGGSTCSAYFDFETTSCSVFNLGGTVNSFCSTRLNTADVSKLCSAFGAPTECSILLGAKGRCSAFGSALPSACTAFAAGAFCSVIGGAPGNPCAQ